MKQLIFYIFFLLSITSHSQSNEIKNFQSEIDEWYKYTFKQFVLNQDKNTIIIYHSNGIVSGVYPDWKEYSNSRKYEIVFTPILSNGEYGSTYTKEIAIGEVYSESDLKEYVNSKIEDVKSSIDNQLEFERQTLVRRKKLKELERKKEEFISLKKTEINKVADKCKKYNDSIVHSIENQFNKVVLYKNDLKQISEPLESYYKNLYYNEAFQVGDDLYSIQGGDDLYYEGFSKEQFDLLNPKALLTYYENGMGYGMEFNPRFDDEYLIIDGDGDSDGDIIVKKLQGRYFDDSFPKVKLSINRFNWFSAMNKHLDPNNGRILFEFALFNDLVTKIDKYLYRTSSSSVKSSIDDGVKLWKNTQIKELEKQVYNFKIEKIEKQSLGYVKYLERIFSIYKDKLIETEFLTENLDQSEKLIHLKELSNKYFSFFSFYKDQFEPLMYDFDRITSYGYGQSGHSQNKVKKVLKSLTKDLELSVNVVNDYKKVVEFVTNGISIEKKLKLSNDFINRIDSNPMNFPVTDIMNLKIFN